MKFQHDSKPFDISKQTMRHLVRCGFAAMTLLGIVAVAYANVPHTFKDGDLLLANDLNENFAALDQRIAAVETSPGGPAEITCPKGYTQSADAPAQLVLCLRGLDEVVRVGRGSAAFWIDRHEASIWSDSAGTIQHYGANGDDYPNTFPDNGQVTASANLLYAISRSGVLPSISMTWLQANIACTASGKRLPTGPEWILAATGTKDPGNNDGSPGACRTSPGERRPTGAPNVDTGCASLWGAQDMIGNVWEYTGEWFAAPTATPNWLEKPWPAPTLQGDGVWNVSSNALVTGTGWAAGMPSVAIRGGSLGNLTLAGVFTFSVTQSPLAIDATVGFRCVVPQ